MPALLALLGGIVAGQVALGRAAAYGEEVERLERVRRGTLRWSAEYRPAAAAESLAWRESERAILVYGPETVDPLVTAALVASRAEELGIREVRIRLAGTDTLSVPEPAAVGPWSVEPAPTAIAVELRTDLRRLVSFLGMLPPQVMVQQVSLDPLDGQYRASFFLLVQQVRRDP